MWRRLPHDRSSKKCFATLRRAESPIFSANRASSGATRCGLDGTTRVASFHSARFGYGDPGTTTGVRDAVPPARMPQWMEGVLDDLSRRHNLPVLNHVVLHRYVDGGDTIGMHHDKTMDLHQSSTIVSLSLGGSRDFRLGPSTFPVHDGDAVLIPYETNRLMKHGVPPRANASTRYSLTARTVHTYSDGLTHRVIAAL